MSPDEEMLYGYLLGELYGQKADFAKAYEHLMAVATKSHDPKVAQRALQAAVATGDTKRILDAANLWRQLAPNAPAAQEAIIGAALDAKAYDIAKDELKNLLAQNPGSRGDYILALPQLLASIVDPRERYYFAKAVLVDFQDMVETQYVLATFAYESKNLDEAIALARGALSNKPNWPPVILLYGNLLRERNPKEAVAFFREKVSNSRKIKISSLAWCSLF